MDHHRAPAPWFRALAQLTKRTAGFAAMAVVGGAAAFATVADAKKDARRIAAAGSIAKKPKASLHAVGTAAPEAEVLLGRAKVLN